MRARWVGIASAWIVVLALPRAAQAIPPFARKYGTACTTCHVGGPKKLNPFGEAFRLNGYQMPGEAELELRRNEEVPLGAPERKSLFPDVVWPGSLPEAFPFGLYAEHRFGVDLEADDGRTGFEGPHEFELVLGGTLGEDIGFFGEPLAIDEGEIEGPGALLLVFTDPLDVILPDGALSIRVGRFAPAAEPYADNTRRTMSHTVVSEGSVAGDGFTLSDRQAGVELFGRPTGRILWHLGLVNGESSVEDPTDSKDVYGGVEVKLGGLPYVATDGPTDAAKPWRDNSLTVGVAGYTGRHLIVPEDPAMSSFRNRFYRVIGKVRAQIADLDVRGAIALGRDEDPDGSGDEVSSRFWSVEADYVILPWLQVLARYDEAKIGDAVPTRTLTPNVRAFLRMNVFLQAETTIVLDSDADRPTILLELFYAF